QALEPVGDGGTTQIAGVVDEFAGAGFLGRAGTRLSACHARSVPGHACLEDVIEPQHFAEIRSCAETLDGVGWVPSRGHRGLAGLARLDAAQPVAELEGRAATERGGGPEYGRSVRNERDDALRARAGAGPEHRLVEAVLDGVPARVLAALPGDVHRAGRAGRSGIEFAQLELSLAEQVFPLRLAAARHPEFGVIGELDLDTHGRS